MPTLIEESRRRFLAGITAIAGSSLVPRSASGAATANTGTCCSHPALEPITGTTGVSVSVHGAEGMHLPEGAEIVVSPSGGPALVAERRPGEVIVIKSPKSGPHQLEVFAAGYEPFSTTFMIDKGVVMYPVYLRKIGWPDFSAYNMGGSIVPFEPVYDKLAIVFEGPMFHGGKVPDAVLSKLKDAGLTPYDPPGGSYVAAHGEILLFQSRSALFAKTPASPFIPATETLLKSLRSYFASNKYGNVRIGIPIITKAGLRVLDNRFVVELSKQVTGGSIADSLDVDVQKIDAFPDSVLVVFRHESNYFRNIDSLNLALRGKQIVTWEPDLIFELQLHGCTHSDPWYDCQTYLTRQKVDMAWPASACGSGVVVTALDTGVNRSIAKPHPDLDRSRVTCFDLMWLSAAIPPQDPTDCDFVPMDGHGMGIYGIIGADHNSQAVSGIAPEATHVAVRMNYAPAMLSYATTLLWAGAIGGIKPVNRLGNTITGAPNLPGAHVINCSHNIAGGGALSCYVARAFEMLTTNGRGGAGTVIVYSAGQANGANGMGANMQGIIAASMSPCTVMVGNTADIDATSVESHDLSANYGDRLAICAFGGLSPPNAQTVSGVKYKLAGPTLREAQVTTPNLSCKGNSADGIQAMGRTSAAAAMVSGVAALILSATRAIARAPLKWYEVRAILQKSGAKLDPSCSNADGVWMNWNGSGWVPAGGAPNPGLDSRSGWYGHGRLDAAAAVAIAVSGPIPSPSPQPCCP